MMYLYSFNRGCERIEQWRNWNGNILDKNTIIVGIFLAIIFIIYQYIQDYKINKTLKE